jgi:CRP/FNR family transcriptional regulator, anaerobic regulatory protein
VGIAEMNTFIELWQNMGFDAQESLEIAGLFQKKIFVKGDYFVKVEQTNQYLGFIEKGLCQYFYNKEGNEITTYVAGANAFVVSVKSFLRQIPSKENIRMLADSIVWLISKKAFENLINQNENFKNFYISLLEYQMVCIDDSLFNQITLTAEERYQKLLTEEPQLLQQIPLQYLASILGITPRHLSRIRKNIR